MRDGRDTPRARTSGLVVKALTDEVLVYDLTRDRAHSLNRAAAAVWRRLDGRTSIGQLARHLGEDLKESADERTVWLALKELDRAHLLAAPLRVPAAQGLSRRQWLRRVGVAAGASAVLVPTVSSIVAPHAYAQASGCSNPGCQTGSCAGGSGSCACVATTSGTTCVEPCCVEGTNGCTSSSNCASGQVCMTQACCGGVNFCVPRCGQPIPTCIELRLPRGSRGWR